MTVAPSISPAPSDPTFRLPGRNPDFTGREALLAELSQALQNSAAAVPQALHGLGGVGKTQLAAEYVYRHVDDYPLIWWIPAESTLQIRESLAQLAERLGIPVSRSGDSESLVKVLEALAASTFRWLLVYDNVDNPETLNGLMPPGGPGHVIITSRNDAVWSARGNAIEVDVFERAESLRHLQRRGRAISTGDAAKIAEKLGDLPLALDQAATWQATTGMPVTEYLKLFDQNIKELMSEGKPIGYPGTIWAIVRLAVDRLRQERPAAAELLELFAFFGPEPIPVTLLSAGRGAELSQPLRTALSRPIELHRAIRAVRSLGLARTDPGQRIQVHRLIQQVLRNELAPARRNQARSNAQQLLAAANPGSPDEPANGPAHSQIRAHVDAAQLLDATDDSVRLVVVDQIRHLFVTGEFEASRHLAESAVARWSRAAPDSPGHELTLVAQRHLANAYRQLGQITQARDLDERMLALLRADPRFGEDHELTLSATNSLGRDQRLAGNFRAALEVEQDNVARHLRVLGQDHESTWRARNNLAASLRQLGRFGEALRIDEQNLRLRSGQAGEDDPRTLFAMANLARDFYGAGAYPRALELIRTVVPRCRELLGPQHVDVLLAARTLTVALRKCGHSAEARDNARRNLDEHYTRFGDRHEHTLSAMNSYAAALRCCGSPPEVTEARTVLRTAVDSYRSAFTADHPFTLAAAVNLAIALRGGGDQEEARQLNETTLPALRRAVGEQHPYTLAAAVNLAQDLTEAGDFRRATELSGQTYQNSIEARGPEHPDTLACAVAVAVGKVAAGDESGTHLLDTAIRTMERVLGPDHPVTRDAARGRRLDCDIEPPPT